MSCCSFRQHFILSEAKKAPCDYQLEAHYHITTVSRSKPHTFTYYTCAGHKSNTFSQAEIKVLIVLCSLLGGQWQTSFFCHANGVDRIKIFIRLSSCCHSWLLETSHINKLILAFLHLKSLLTEAFHLSNHSREQLSTFIDPCYWGYSSHISVSDPNYTSEVPFTM